jgi:hypothetical protein
VWASDRQPAARFADFEAALVREGLRLRRAESQLRRATKEHLKKP